MRPRSPQRQQERDDQEDQQRQQASHRLRDLVDLDPGGIRARARTDAQSQQAARPGTARFLHRAQGQPLPEPAADRRHGAGRLDHRAARRRTESLLLRRDLDHVTASPLIRTVA
ncbi:MAG: hypothetical protein MZV70_43210 [Desulfobacterales bacterium]|nr:hypothetical protein [Desulfobacterales bacterium]